MKQNKYDDPEFFARYSGMPRSRHGLNAAGEWPAFRSLLPDLTGKRVLDLGCGFGWHCRYAREQKARSVVGVDLSESMLARARQMSDDPAIEYRRAAIEDASFAPADFDVVISSLALHYVERFDLVCRNVCRWLAPGGAFVLSVEHPIFTATEAQDWHYGANGERLHWPIDKYQQEGIRHTRWMAENVIKYHRTVATYLNTLVEAGFRIVKVLEPEPSQEMLIGDPALKDETRRPMFLLISAAKPVRP
jgi:SAM-dependent methyltransferase